MYSYSIPPPLREDPARIRIQMFTADDSEGDMIRDFRGQTKAATEGSCASSCMPVEDHDSQHNYPQLGK
jgi:hypothetical protein